MLININGSITTHESIVALASRKDRLLAFLIDGFFPIIGMLIFLWFSLTTHFPEALLLILAIIGCIAYTAIQIYYLWTSSQTIGKHMLEMVIVDNKTNKKLSFWRIVLLRYFIGTLPCIIPMAGRIYFLLDALSICGEEKRCIHDHIAGSKVITIANKGENQS